MKDSKKQLLPFLCISAIGCIIWIIVSSYFTIQQIKNINTFLGNGILNFNNLINYFTVFNCILIILRGNISIKVAIIIELILLLPLGLLVYYFMR